MVGVNAAILYQNIFFWCERNAAKRKNLRDGNYWTYNSVSAFHELFPYLTEKQIRVALDKLETSGLIEVGCFNEDARDRTRWYALVDKSLLPSEAVTFALQGKSTFAPEGEPLPVGKPDLNNKPPNPQGGLFESQDDLTEEDANFDAFYAAYPVKKGKANARKAWDKAIRKTPAATIIEAAKRYADFLQNPPKGRFIPTPKYPQGWLNGGHYEDEDIWSHASAAPSWDDLSESQRRMIERGQCPPSMQNPDGTPNTKAAALLKQVAL